MRPHLPFAAFLLLPLAACAHQPGGTTATAAPPAATSAAPTTAASPAGTGSTSPAGSEPSKAGSKAKPSGSQDPRSGTQYALLVSGTLSTRRITYDLVEWFDGDQAVKACAEDGVKPAENDYCVGYYLRNNNKKLRTLTVYPDAPIHLGPDARPVDLTTFLAETHPETVITFEVDAGRIMKLDEVFLP